MNVRTMLNFIFIRLVQCGRVTNSQTSKTKNIRVYNDFSCENMHFVFKSLILNVLWTCLAFFLIIWRFLYSRFEWNLHSQRTPNEQMCVHTKQITERKNREFIDTYQFGNNITLLRLDEKKKIVERKEMIDSCYCKIANKNWKKQQTIRLNGIC